MAAAASVQSFTTEPLFYGPPSALSANDLKLVSNECLLSAEEFIDRMDASRLQHHPNDQAAAISRTTANLRAQAREWWKNTLAVPHSSINLHDLQNNWDTFSAHFRRRWFKLTDRWDTAQSYLDLRQLPSEDTACFFGRIITAYVKDMTLAKASGMSAGHHHLINPLSAQERAKVPQTPESEYDGWQEIVIERAQKYLTAAFNDMRNVDLSRALALGCKSDLLRTAIRKKASKDKPEPQDLEDFVRFEEKTRATGKPASGKLNAIETDADHQTPEGDPDQGSVEAMRGRGRG